MIGLTIGVAIGLFVGWWFLPQPEWARRLYERLKASWGKRSGLGVLVLVVAGGVLLGGCNPNDRVVSIAGACSVFPNPQGQIIYGKRRSDQRWIDTTYEGGISACGWRRPVAAVRK